MKWGQTGTKIYRITVPKPVKGLDGMLLIVRREMGIPLHHFQGLVPYQVHDVIQRDTFLDKPGGESVTQIVKAEAFKVRLSTGPC